MEMNDNARIVLVSGKQGELIKKAKEASKYNWPKLARELGVGTNYLKNELAKEQHTLREDVYGKLCELAKYDYSPYIAEIRNKNWGRSKGGKLSKHHETVAKLLVSEPSENLAEFFGAMLGDGGIHKRKNGSHYQIRITGHIEQDKEYMSNYLPELMERIFAIKPSIYERKNTNSIVLSKQSKDLVYTLEYMGLQAGNKLNYLNPPNWLYSKQEYMKRFLRGLIDTDGSVCPKTPKHLTPAIWFTSASRGIREAATKSFKALGYRVSIWTKRSGQNGMQCSIGNSSDVLKYYKEIGFANRKHQIRFRKFCKAPIV